MPPDLVLADYVEAEGERIVADLFEWLKIPSISADPGQSTAVRRSAEFAVSLLTSAGMEHAEVVETGGAPAVYADWLHAGPAAVTALVYGHHDVQPVDPLHEWRTPPFEPTLADGECRARGAVDDKGQLVFQIEAARGLLQRHGRLPLNLKFLVEGEEEVGSPHFEELLQTEKQRLECDVVVVSDTTMWGPAVPSTCVGLRGLVAFDVTIHTALTDLHSGSFGGAVLNSAHVVAGLVASLHGSDGRVTLPGFYDDVRPLTEAEERSLALLPFDEDEWKQKAGVQRLDGEDGRSTLERIWTRPTCEVVGITAGYGGKGMKTAVPGQANVKITFRLVPDQDPERISRAFNTWLEAHVPGGVTYEVEQAGAVAPALTAVDHPALAALHRAIERVWGRAPLLTREGGSGPEEALGRVLGAPVLYLGVGLPDDQYHAPNERMVMDQFWKGLLAAGELWGEVARAHG